jgi:hypothetical protein
MVSLGQTLSKLIKVSLAFFDIIIHLVDILHDSQNASSLAGKKKYLIQKGENGKQYYLEHFLRKRITVDKLIDIFKSKLHKT